MSDIESKCAETISNLLQKYSSNEYMLQRIHNHIVTEEELKTKTYNVIGTSMGWRRTISLVRRNNERQKKCPFGFGE